MPFPGVAVQYPCYAHFCANFKEETEWLAVFDLDEFVLPHRHEALCDFLAEHPHVDGFGINWVMFGDGLSPDATGRKGDRKLLIS